MTDQRPQPPIADDLQAPRLLAMEAREAVLKSRIEELENALDFLLQTRWKSVEKDNMEFEGRVTCYQLDRARDALSNRSAKP